MGDVVGSEITQGQEVKWYVAGSAGAGTVERKTYSGGSLTLAATAEWGLVVASGPGGNALGVTETGSESGGTTAITVTGATSGQEITIRYIPITTALVQVAAALDVKMDSTTEVTKETIHGQANKVVFRGATEYTGSMDQFVYNQEFLKAVAGDAFDNSPSSGNKKFSTAFHGPKAIGGLVGKRYDASGNVIYKWGFLNTQFEGIGLNFPRNAGYQRNMRFSCDAWIEVDLS